MLLLIVSSHSVVSTPFQLLFLHVRQDTACGNEQNAMVVGILVSTIVCVSVWITAVREERSDEVKMSETEHLYPLLERH